MAPHLSLRDSVASRESCGLSLAACSRIAALGGETKIPPAKPDLAQCDGKRIAVVLAIEGKRQVLRGVGHWSDHPTLGNALRIPLEGDPSCASEILLTQDSWSGEVKPDTQYGCDLSITLF
jgi:hypothetical protein